MGKGKKKKAGRDRESHRAKMLERRIKANSAAFGADTELGQAYREMHQHTSRNEKLVRAKEVDRINFSTLLPGDRVWFFYHPSSDENDPNTYRGLLRSIHQDGFCEVQPISNYLKNDPTTLRIEKSSVRRDHDAWGTKHKVGEEVVCRTHKGWIPGTITHLWPIWEKEVRKNIDANLLMPVYKLWCYPEKAGREGEPFQLLIREPEKNVIESPKKMRFKEGDTVVINTRKNSSCYDSHHPEWIKAKIRSADVKGHPQFYVAYLIMMGENQTYFILKDDDEHIASAEPSKGRDRFFDSVEQGCTFDHLNYLVKKFDMDLSPIVDTVLERAIEHGSFEAFRWLEERMEVNLASLRFEGGDTLLHRMVTSPQSERFFEQYSRSLITSKTSLDEIRGSESPHRVKNDKGQDWLQVLLDAGNVYNLDLVFSLRGAIFWSISDRRKYSSSVDLKGSDRNSIVNCVIDEFWESSTLLRQMNDLHMMPDTEKVLLDKPSMKPLLHEQTSMISAKKLVRFARDWVKAPMVKESLASILMEVTQRGYAEVFKLLFKADQSVVDMGYDQNTGSKEVIFDLGVCLDDFCQHELIEEKKKQERHEYDKEKAPNIMTILVRGKQPDRPRSSDDKTFRQLTQYLEDLRSMAVGTGKSGITNFNFLHQYFNMNLTKSYDYITRSLYQHQLSLLQNDRTVPGRTRILEYLVNEEGWAPPNVIDTIRMRQPGIFEWVIRYNIMNKGGGTIFQNDLNTPLARCLEFMGGWAMPKGCSSATFLAFACVELDSLNILAWLVEREHVPIQEYINGFNMLHICAFFGRMEIIVWLRSTQGWDDYVKGLSKRQGYEQRTAAHVAVLEGNTIIADLLLQMGCSPVDGKGETIDETAASSSREHVRKWGEKKAGPFRLEKRITKLFRFLQKGNYAAAKRYVVSSMCLQPQQWIDSYLSFDDPLPSGATYRSTFLRCVNSEIDEDFAMWLCHELTTKRANVRNDYAPLDQLNQYWKKPKYHSRSEWKTIDNTQVEDIIQNHDVKEISHWLSKPWAKGLKAIDHEDANPILRHNCLNKKRAERFKVSALKIELYYQLLHLLNDHSIRQIAQGAPSETILELYNSYRAIAERLAEAQNIDLADIFSTSIFTDDENEFINMNVNLHTVEYDQTHALHNHYLLFGDLISPESSDMLSIHRVLAIENYDHLIKTIHQNGRGWTPSMELEVVRISSFFSSNTIVDYFLKSEEEKAFRTSLEQRCHAAMLGAAETGRLDDWLQLIGKSGHIDDALAAPFIDAKFREGGKLEADSDMTSDRKKAILSSLSTTCVYGYMLVASGCNTRQYCSLENYEGIFKNLLEDYGYNATIFLRALSFILASSPHKISIWEAMIKITNRLYSNFGLNPFEAKTKKTIDEISTMVIKRLRTGLKERQEFMSRVVCKWLIMIATWGTNIQNIHLDEGGMLVESYTKEMKEDLHNIKAKQRGEWAELDIMKQGCELNEIEAAVENGSLKLSATDKGGLRPIHLAAAYNRVDVLAWLVESKNVDFDQRDYLSRSVLDIARGSKAHEAATWIVERRAKGIIASFLRKHFVKFVAQRRRARIMVGVTRLQARQRGIMARKRHRGVLISTVEEAHRFHYVWKGAEESLSVIGMKPFSWSSFRGLQETRVSDKLEFEGLLETEERLGAAMKLALEEEVDFLDGVSNEEVSEDLGKGKTTRSSAKECVITKKTTIHLSSDVVKWLRQADMKYREFFVRRIQQLQNGDRSRILAKRLRGSESTIFETYLEQKSGHRILWQDEANERILIWYVAKHKHVSRLMRLIDDSESRSMRQRVEASSVIDSKASDDEDTNQKNRVVLNPRGNVPLKVYELKGDSITDVLDASWSPQLYLSKEEKSIVEASGTVLLLGRSGTGKTVCICNRMDLDRRRHQQNHSFSQLFVARSRRLARYVSEMVGRQDRCTFTTFGELLHTLESQLPEIDSARTMFLPSQKMNFSRFKRDDICSGTIGQNKKQYIDPMIAWTNIRTFIKGSIEALSGVDQVMDKETFLQLGRKRCRLDTRDREAVYDVFTRYQKVMTEQNLWDDNDRISALLQRLTFVLDSEHQYELFEKVKQSKIYVDEIQDYTQSEILLFFRLCGPGNLFLAGDPAQSVVEGVEFRFEEIRSVGYFVAGPERRDLIPEKPKKVTVNFRSHSGVLNTAAAILRRLFDTFPDSAKELAEDRGVFTGPRPGVFQSVGIEQLKCLVTEKLNGIVVLTHDEKVSYWKRALGGYPLVYGIRGAKGLEFKRVMVLGFFAELPRDLQKPWRDLLLDRETARQELEAKLKLLYTAVTRCIEQLFFTETVRSTAGDAFVRWATTTSVRPEVLATRQSVENVETMVMTQDEWIASGLENAEIGESYSSTSIEESLSMFEKALFCFEQGKDDDLSRKARAQKASLLFRQRLRDSSIQWNENGGVVEFDSVLMVEQLVSENLLLEARRMLELSVLPLMGPYTQEQVKKNILSKLPLENSLY